MSEMKWRPISECELDDGDVVSFLFNMIYEFPEGE